MNREDIRDFAKLERLHHLPVDNDSWIDGFICAFEWTESHNDFMENDRNLELINAIKCFCGLTDEQVYPVVSFMCLNEYIKGWDCIDDSFYIGDRKISA